MNATNMSAVETTTTTIKTTKPKQKVIGFALDGVLRNISRSLDSVYRKCYPNRPVKTPVNPYNILESYTFESQEEFAEFLTAEAPTVFGRAEEVHHGVVHEFNKVCAILKENGYKPVLISKEVGKTKPGSLFFLSFTGCEIDDIRFVTKLEDFWDGIDILVTANPEVIALRPERKRAIKVHRNYNRDVKHVRKINNIKDLPKLLNINTEPKALAAAAEVKALPAATPKVKTEEEIKLEGLMEKYVAYENQVVDPAQVDITLMPVLRDVDTTHMNTSNLVSEPKQTGDQYTLPEQPEGMSESAYTHLIS